MRSICIPDNLQSNWRNSISDMEKRINSDDFKLIVGFKGDLIIDFEGFIYENN